MPDNPDDPVTEEEILEWEIAEAALKGTTTDPELVRLKNLSLEELMNEDVEQIENEIEEMREAESTPTPHNGPLPDEPDGGLNDNDIGPGDYSGDSGGGFRDGDENED